MTDTTKPSRDDLIAMLPTPGWQLKAGDKAHASDVTLEEAAKAAHARHAGGEDPGFVSKVEAEVELDLLRLQELWAHLGLPV